MNIDAFAQNRRLGRGVNIIGYDDALWRTGKGRFQDKHFRLIKEAGFNHVRINVHPFKFTGDDHTIAPLWLETLDWAVEQALGNDLVVILDVHEFHAMSRDPMGLKAKFLSVWDQLASRYKMCPDTVLFEMLNEPHDKLTVELWNKFLLEPYNLIRGIDPDHTLIIGPAFWNGIDHIEELELPEADRNIIVTVHYYHPMDFTHQGAPWSKHGDKTGVEWHATPEALQRIVLELGKVQAWAEQQKRPIHLGEFGAYDAADMDSRARYVYAVTRHAEHLGWSWSYWQLDKDFVLYDIDKDSWVTPILNALIPPES